MIHDVIITPLKIIEDDRGRIMHMLRCDASVYEQFGEIYFSTVFPGAVKAWKRHRRMRINLTVPVGRIRLVLYDGREGSSSKGKFQVILIGPDNYVLVTVPPLIWFGVAGMWHHESFLANLATLPHDPAELERCPAHTSEIPYIWDLGFGD